MWCYACESYVSEPELDPVLNRCIELIKSKFNKGFHSQSIDRQTILVGTKCTHLQQSVDIQELHRIYGKRSDDTDSCVKCDDNIFNPYLWLCLKCGTELCGRSANGHALRHHNHKVNEIDKSFSCLFSTHFVISINNFVVSILVTG